MPPHGSENWSQLNLWPTATSTAETSRTSPPQTSPATRNTTSSLASVSGPTHSAWPDGQTIAPPGPAHVHVSRSPRQAKALGLLTSGTYGQPGNGSSASIALASSLASKLKGKDGRMWLDLVSTDLEANSYACGPVVFPSSSVGAPNIRHRLYWVADTARGGSSTGPHEPSGEHEAWQSDGPGDAGRLADIEGRGWREHRLLGEATGGRQDTGQSALGDEASAGGMGDTGGARLSDAEPPELCGAIGHNSRRTVAEPSGPHDPWRFLEWIACTDGKYRPTQSRVQRVASGDTAGLGFVLSAPETAEVWPLSIRQKGDVQKLRAYGNAINPVAAAEFIRAYMELNR